MTKTHTKAEAHIADWRRDYRAGILSASKIKRIERIAGWSWGDKPK